MAPYLEHLLAWDCRITADSTAATLCQAWYELLYGAGYPGEDDARAVRRTTPRRSSRRWSRAAETLESLHGDWKVPYGEVYRMQRQPRVADLVDARFDDGGAEPAVPRRPWADGRGVHAVLLAERRRFRW